MALSVVERGNHVATYRWVAVQIMETLARWVPTTPEMEAKLLFGPHIWSAAQCADWLGQRTYELRLPPQHDREPVTEYKELAKDLAAVEDTASRFSGIYEVLLPSLLRRMREHRAEADELLDAPTIKVVERIGREIEEMIADGEAVKAQLPALQATRLDWTKHQLKRDAAIASIVAPVAAGARG